MAVSNQKPSTGSKTDQQTLEALVELLTAESR